jgi:hypothetical protein
MRVSRSGKIVYHPKILCCNYSNKDCKTGIKPAMHKVLRQLAVQLATRVFTEEEAKNESKKIIFKSFICN